MSETTWDDVKDAEEIDGEGERLLHCDFCFCSEIEDLQDLIGKPGELRRMYQIHSGEIICHPCREEIRAESTQTEPPDAE